jgi:hypothetical protein
VFARREEKARGMPERVHAFAGELPQRDAAPAEARGHLKTADEPRPTAAAFAAASPYREVFRQGATLVPRMLCLVERVTMGRLGADPAAPMVRSRRSAQEKKPWKDLEAMQAPVEAEFVRPVYLGESIAPYRVLGAVEGVIPYSDRVLTAKTAAGQGFRHLARWLTEAEALWDAHGSKRVTLAGQFDYYGKLSSQFPIKSPRVVYAASGTLLAAALLDDPRGVVEHKLYWLPASSRDEAHYLCALLNSEALRIRIAKFQSRGQWGARDIDKYVFNMPIPRFAKGDRQHAALSEAGKRAAAVAARVPLSGEEHFIAARRKIRDALVAAGLAAEIDRLVERLLGAAGR